MAKDNLVPNPANSNSFPGTTPLGNGASEITDVNDFIAALREAIGPRLDGLDKEWEEHGPAILNECALVGIELETYGGNCPVQIEGTFDGLRFYFRARGDEWQFHVAKTDADIFNNDLFYIERDYGDGPFDAGWMPLHEAMGFVMDAVAEFRTQ